MQPMSTSDKDQKSQPGSPSAAPVVRFRLTAEDEKRFRQRCAENGTTYSEVLKAFVQKYIDTPNSKEAEEPAVPAGGDEFDPFVRITCTLRSSLKNGLASEAKKSGISTSKYVSYLVQSNLTRAPVLTDYELAAVLSSRRELKSIGRNLNQITKSINEASKMGMPLANHHLLTKTHLEIVGNAVEKVNFRISKLADARYWVWSGHDTAPPQPKNSPAPRVTS